MTFLFLNEITKLRHYQKQCQCYLTLSKKKHDIQKIRDCIRSNSEKRDTENKQKKYIFLLMSANKGSLRSGIQT